MKNKNKKTGHNTSVMLGAGHTVKFLKHENYGVTFIKYPICFVSSDVEISLEERFRIIESHRRRLIGDTYTHKIGKSLLIYDFYVLENLSIAQRLRHHLRKLRAAVSGNIGINARIVVVVAN